MCEISQIPHMFSQAGLESMKGAERMIQNMPTDMQYKDGLRKDYFINKIIKEAVEKGDYEKALEYLKENEKRIEKALED